MSWSFWANVYAVTNQERFFDWGNGLSSDNLLFTPSYGTSGDMGMSIYNGAAHADQLVGATPTINTWNHFVLTVDASGRVCVYQNGTQLAALVNNPPNTVVRTNMYLGRSNFEGPNNPNAKFNGSMYDFQFALGYVFTAYDVANLFNGLGCPTNPPPPPPLPPSNDHVVCPKVTNRWPLNSGYASGATVLDTVGNWNGVTYGGYSYIAGAAAPFGAIALDGVSGYVQVGPQAGASAGPCRCRSGPTCTLRQSTSGFSTGGTGLPPTTSSSRRASVANPWVSQSTRGRLM